MLTFSKMRGHLLLWSVSVTVCCTLIWNEDASVCTTKCLPLEMSVRSVTTHDCMTAQAEGQPYILLSRRYRTETYCQRWAQDVMALCWMCLTES